MLRHYDAEYDTASRVFEGQWRPRNRTTGTDGIMHKWRDPNGNLIVLVFYWDGSKRNLNYNWFDNPWNRQNYRFAGRRLRNSLHFTAHS